MTGMKHIEQCDPEALALLLGSFSHRELEAVQKDEDFFEGALLHRAVFSYKRDIRCIKVLLDHGASINHVSWRARLPGLNAVNPLMMGITGLDIKDHEGFLEIMLAREDLNIHTKDRSGFTALHYGLAGEHTMCADKLWKKGARLEPLNDGTPALMHFAKTGCLVAVKWVIEVARVDVLEEGEYR